MLVAAAACAAAMAAAAPAHGAIALDRRVVATLDDYFVDVQAPDLDGDRRPDLVASDSRGKLRVFMNRGAGRFEPGVAYKVPDSLGSAAAADVDRDGDLDVAVAGEGSQLHPDFTHSTGGLWVLRNDGQGGLAPAVRYATGRQSDDVASADLNGDGWPDFVTANSVPGADPPAGSAISVLLNTGDGNLAPAQEPTRFNYGVVLALADMDLDGRTDLLSGAMSVSPGRGDGTFGDPISARVGELWGIQVADLNLDGLPDAVTGIFHDRHDIAVIPGASGGRLGAVTRAEIGDDRQETYGGLVLANLDSGRAPDIAFADDAGLHVAPGTGRGTFGAATRYRPGAAEQAELAAADFDLDGRVDVARVVTEGRVDVFLNRGEGRQAPLVLPSAGAYRTEADGTVHVLLRCGSGVGRCAGRLTVSRGGTRLGSQPYDIAPGASERIRVRASRAGTGSLIALAADTGAGTRRATVRVVRPTASQRRAACRQSGTTTVASSPQGRVFFDREGFVAFGCLYSSGAWAVLDVDYPDGPFATSGRHAAFVARDLCDAELCIIEMFVYDLSARRWVTVGDTSVDPCAAQHDCGVGQVGRIVLSPRGAVAWTACPGASQRCPKRAGDRVDVYRIDRRGLRRVASGKGIEPYSLRRRGGRITWTDGGRMRSSTLAGTPPRSAPARTP